VESEPFCEQSKKMRAGQSPALIFFLFVKLARGAGLYTKARNGLAISCFNNPYWVCLLIHKNVVTFL
jgi:hypothetical protein